MITNKCGGCGAMLELDETRERHFCQFCGFSIILPRQEVIQQVTKVVHVNSNFNNKMAMARNWEKMYWEQGPKSVTFGEHKGFNAIIHIYCEAEVDGGAAEPSYWLAVARFYSRALLSELAAGSLKLLSKRKVLIDYTTFIDHAIEYSDPNDRAEVEREKAETLNNLERELSQYPEKKPNGNTALQEKGCFVATAVYGSYDCPEVWTLRRYRDYKLSNSIFGRLFIKVYYRTSPTLIKWFGRTKWFNSLSKCLLDKKVKKLQKKGFDNTPYCD